MSIRIAAAFIATVALAGCNEEERQKRNSAVESRLPNGCVVRDLGDYYTKDRERVPLVMVTCKGGVEATAIGWRVQTGKVLSHRSSVILTPTTGAPNE